MIIVTGSTGFLGSLLIPKIAEKGNVLCLIPESQTVRMAGRNISESDLIRYYEKLGIKTLNYPARGSVSDYKKALSQVNNISDVVYMAANNNQDVPYDNLHKDNVEVLGVFIESLGNKLNGARFIFTSSVMAKACNNMLKSGYKPETLKKIAPYGFSKLMAERKIIELSKKYKFKPIILRLASLYGKTASTGLMISVKSLANISKRVPTPYFPGKFGIILADDVAEVISNSLGKNYDDEFYYVDDMNPVPMGELVKKYGRNNGFNTKSVKIPGFAINLGKKICTLSAKAGISPALKALALLDDIFVTYDNRIWNLTGNLPSQFSKDKKAVKGRSEGIKVAITGSTGLIGSKLARKLWDKGFNVRCGIHSSGNISKLPHGAEIFQCDLDDVESLSSFMKGQDFVIHAAALTNSKKHKAEDYKKVNLDGTANVISACLKSNVKNLIFFGSEAAHPNAKGNYGKTKYLAEQLVKRQNLNWVVLKPGQVISKESFIPKMASKIKKGSMILPIPSNTPRNLELIDVDDLTESVLHIVNDKTGKFRHKTIYLGSEEKVNIEDVFDELCKSSKKRPLKIKLPKLLLNKLASIPFSPITLESLDSLYTSLPNVEEKNSIRMADESWKKVLRKYM